MNYAEIKYYDIANGPGVRVSLFVSGCHHRCKGCFNEIAWDFNYGSHFNDIVKMSIINQLKKYYIKGLTLLGGEPLAPENWPVLHEFAKDVKCQFPSKTIWCYTGYVCNVDILNVVSDCVDVLVDGPFIEERKDISLCFRGSNNQRIIDVQKTMEAKRIILLTSFEK